MTNVQVIAAGTKIEQDDKNKPVQVAVVTLLVNPDEAEKLTLASTEGKIQLALRNPLDQSSPATPGIKPAILLGVVKAPAQQQASAKPKPGQPVTVATTAPAALPTVEMIRGEKRAMEVIK